MADLKSYLLIASANLRHNYLMHLAAALLLLLITPAIFSISNLDEKLSAVPLEMFVVLEGVILLTPVFLPEQQTELRELVESKHTSQNVIHVIRIIFAMIVLMLFITVFLLLMLSNGCRFDLLSLSFGTFAGGAFLGALGLLTYSMSDNITFGYMIPVIYFIFNFFGGDRYLGKLYLFSMTHGSYEQKYWLFGAAMLMLVMTILGKSTIRKLR